MLLVGSLSLIPYFLSPIPAYAADCILSIRSQDISITPVAPFLNQSARIYATVQPACDQDAEGSVLFYANGALIGNKPISYKQAGRAEEVWVNWRPTEYGETTIRVDTKGEGGEVGDSASITLFIDRDTDGDGIGDREDPDDDNDGVPDGQDQFPLDPNKTRDTDGDGQDDSVDSDDDNDGLYDFEEEQIGTNPKKYDTDGDGVGDKQDAYPLDPKRSKAPEPASMPEPVPVQVPDSESVAAVTLAANEPDPLGEARVLGEVFENGMATSDLPRDLADSSDGVEDGMTWLDWVRGFGLWLLLALAFLALGIFFFWQDKKKRRDEEG
ncbi:hypothetical protein EDM68_00025 [Candidatus Uhrbacteria bacterium]|nr:MAG: hypothetical protein EDM68_00025 [Candidatus Uhrbacteria bacterium]